MKQNEEHKIDHDRKVVVIYHRADYDGLFSMAVCGMYIDSNSVELIGWDYHDPIPEIPEDVAELYMVDISIPELMEHPKLIWIDHHKTAIDRFPSSIPGYRIDGVAACRLCYVWFNYKPLRSKEDFVERLIDEPVALRLAGEYDVGDTRDPTAKSFQFGLYGTNIRQYSELRRLLLNDEAAWALANEGKIAERWQENFAAGICKEYVYVRELCGVRFAVLASVHARSSLWFPEEALPAEAEALLTWRYDGKAVTFSLYHRPSHTHLDLSAIARLFGGGGHKGACGFALPFEKAMEIIT